VKEDGANKGASCFHSTEVAPRRGRLGQVEEAAGVRTRESAWNVPKRCNAEREMEVRVVGVGMEVTEARGGPRGRREGCIMAVTV
jgi:hypothetical protein